MLYIGLIEQLKLDQGSCYKHIQGNQICPRHIQVILVIQKQSPCNNVSYTAQEQNFSLK